MKLIEPSDEENLLVNSPISPQVNNWFKGVYYSHFLRYTLASLLGLGKLLQAAGQDTLGILKLLIYFGSTNLAINYGILSPLVFINLLFTLSTRINKIFEYCLLPSVYWISNINQFYFQENDKKKYFLIDEQNNSLNYIGINAEKSSQINLTDSGLEELKSFKTLLLNNIVKLHPSENTKQPISISQYFTAEHCDVFNKINRKREHPANWEQSTKILYSVLYGGCAISTVFSGATAYLSGVTLAKTCYSHFNAETQVFLGSYVAVCAILAYVSFNLKTMRRSVKDTCESFNDGAYHGSFGIPMRAMKWTIATTFLGVFASAGMAYFSMNNAVKVLPFIKDLPAEWQETLIFINVIISFFPSIFNFASGCYTQIKNIIPEDSVEVLSFYQHFFSFYKQLTTVTLWLTFLILIDSISNSFGTFLGTHDLLERLFNQNQSSVTSQIFSGLSILITVSNVFLNFGMTMTGTEEAFQKCNACAYGQNKNTMYQPLASSSEVSFSSAYSDAGDKDEELEESLSQY